MKESILKDKSLDFAVRIVKLNDYLCHKKFSTVAKQVLRSGTSIGANIAEASQAQSPADFVSKLGIAQKEASETAYWLKLSLRTGKITDKEYQSIIGDLEELQRMIAASILTCKQNNNLK